MAKQAEPDVEPDSETGKLTMGDLSKMIEDKIAAIVPGILKSGEPKSAEPAAPASGSSASSIDIAEEVRAQVARLKEQEDRLNKEKETDSTIKTLLERTEQKQPIERRKVHKWMGWGDPD
jgi:hypothetical protein